MAERAFAEDSVPDCDSTQAVTARPKSVGALDIMRTAARSQMVQGNDETLTFVSEANTRAVVPYRRHRLPVFAPNVRRAVLVKE